ASFAILALAVVGMEVLSQARERPRWLWWFVALLVALCAWSAKRCTHWPEPLASEADLALRQGNWFIGLRDLITLRECQHEFSQYHLYGAILCCLAICGWWTVLFRVKFAGWHY